MQELLSKAYTVKEISLDELKNYSKDGETICCLLEHKNNDEALSKLEKMFPELRCTYDFKVGQSRDSDYVDRGNTKIEVLVTTMSWVFKGYDDINKVVYVFYEDIDTKVEVC